MQFSSAFFLILFLPIVFLCYFCMLGKDIKYRNAILLLFSIIFYAWGESLFIFILLVSIGINFFMGLAIENNACRKKLFLLISLLFNIGILFIFKYLTFVLSNLALICKNVIIVEIALPIGISFYTFQVMSYIFDVYYGSVPAQHNFFSLSLYLMMFPQLIAGPIVRYNSIASEIKYRKENLEDVSYGISRFAIGLAKKVLLADLLGAIAEKIFVMAKYSEILPATAWIGAITYTLEIYYDFSGYSDMAIGLGRCFGFHFQENFNYPYISRSITDFWRRWHISLTDWFRDYVYIPLGGNRVSDCRHILNLFIVWLLTGIWHGAEWTFIIWGLIYFIFQMLEKYTGFHKKLPLIIGNCYTMLVVIICWVIFKADNVTEAVSYIRSMFNLQNGFWNSESVDYLKSSLIITVVAVGGAFPISKKIKVCLSRSNWGKISQNVLQTVFTLTLLVISLLFIVNGSYSPFIYFNF